MGPVAVAPVAPKPIRTNALTLDSAADVVQNKSNRTPHKVLGPTPSNACALDSAADVLQNKSNRTPL